MRSEAEVRAKRDELLRMARSSRYTTSAREHYAALARHYDWVLGNEPMTVAKYMTRKPNR